MSLSGTDGATVKARFRIKLPDDMWITEVSQTYPDATFRLLTGLRTTTGAIELGEVITDTPAGVSESIRSHPSIASYHLLDITDDRSLARYETTTSEFYEFVEQSAVAPEYPIPVQNGWFEYDLTATHDEYDAFRHGLHDANLSYELVSIVRYYDTERLITDRQHQVLETALREGYFAVPRDCTLAELAETLGIDKSTASEILRRAEASIVTSYLTGVSTTEESTRSR